MGARTNWDVLYPFKVKIASAGGLFHLEREENSGNYCAATYPPRSLSHTGKGEQTGKSTASVRGRRLRKEASFIAGCGKTFHKEIGFSAPC